MKLEKCLTLLILAPGAARGLPWWRLTSLGHPQGMGKLKQSNQKKFYSSGAHSLSFNNSEDILSLINDNGNENRFEDNKNKSSQNINLFLFTNIINILENEPVNNETKLKIERFLHAQFDEFLSSKGRSLVLGVDTKMFTTPGGEVNLIITVLMIQELWKY